MMMVVLGLNAQKAKDDYERFVVLPFLGKISPDEGFNREYLELVALLKVHREKADSLGIKLMDYRDKYDYVEFSRQRSGMKKGVNVVEVDFKAASRREETVEFKICLMVVSEKNRLWELCYEEGCKCQLYA